MAQPSETKKCNITDKIMLDIINGIYLPGQKLGEGPLAERFRSSRAPVREALLNLVNLGFVQQIPRRGFQVTSLNKKEIINSYVVGGVLEGYALSQSIHCFFEADFTHLERLLEAIKTQISENGDFKSISLLDAQFHNFLISKYDSELLHTLASRTSRSIAHYLYFKQWAEIQSLDTFHNRHLKIIDVMKTKHLVDIEHTIREHYAETGYRLGEYVEAQNGGGMHLRRHPSLLMQGMHLEG